MLIGINNLLLYMYVIFINLNIRVPTTGFLPTLMVDTAEIIHNQNINKYFLNFSDEPTCVWL